MVPNLLKNLLSTLYYRPGTEHRILAGPMRGMWFKCSDNTGLAALYSGNEKANQRVYASVVRPGDVVIDAGANWGVHTLYLARLVGGSGHVHAFEPHPTVIDELRWHVSRNMLENVTIHACGLLDINGSIPFFLGANSKTSHVATIADLEHAPRTSQIEVPCSPLDEVVSDSRLDALRLIKIDVEGAEGKALQGAEATIRRFRPHLVVELHSPEQDLEVANTLVRWGYRLTRVEGPELLHVNLPWPEPNGVWGTIHAIPL